MSAIGSAIREGRPWVDRFTRREYAKAFRSYVDTYWEACHAEISAAGDGLPALAEAVIDELEEGRRRTRFWNRGAQAFDEKHTVIKYFVPMLLQRGEDSFAECLREAWCRRWPKDPYAQATYEELQKGFVNVIMGIQLPDKD